MKDEIIRLLSSKHYQRLAGYQPPFDPFDVLGVSDREMSHSSMLHWLLTDPENGAFRKKFFEWLSKLLGIDYDDQKIEVETEYSVGGKRFDLFIRVPSLNLVVCVEVKIWAGEGANQIHKYQEILETIYSDCRKAVIFLTPSGDEPGTGCDNSEVPVLCLSWEEIARFLDYSSDDSERQIFRDQCRNHIRRSILMCKEERKIVKSFLQEGENRKTIRKILDYLPNLGDEEYQEKYRKIVAEVVSLPINDLELYVHPSKGRHKKELKIMVGQWNDAGLPLTLMLYQYEKSAVRVFVDNTSYENTKETLDRFAKAAGLDGKFEKIVGWTWWRAVLDEPHCDIPETIISENLDVYDDGFWDQVEQKLSNQLTPKILSTIWEMVDENKIAQT